MFSTEDTTIVCIDLQQKLVNMLKDSDKIAKNCEKLMQAASILNIDTIITEQYPLGLGSTIDEIKNIKDFKTIEKTTFSVLKTSEFQNEFNKLKNKNVIIFGIETHICVLQSALDLINNNYNVYIVSNCSASRDIFDHNCALNLAQAKGAKIISLEIALFDFLKSSKHEKFKQIQALIK